MTSPELDVADWRRRVAELHAAVRAERAPADGHGVWRAGRDELFATHPQSPLGAGDPLRAAGLPCWPYVPAMRFEVELVPAPPAELRIETGSDGTVAVRRIGRVTLGALGAPLDVWWLDQYGGGVWLPLRDSTAGTTTYGGGRYLLDTAKGADLGSVGEALVVDLNFAYHPSCRYSSAWSCPLAPAGNTVQVAVEAGERLAWA